MLTIALDSVIARDPLLDLVGAFYALEPPTRLKLRDETLLGTIEALTSGEADLAIGAVLDAASLAFTATGIRTPAARRTALRLRRGAAPSAGASSPQPLSDEVLRQHRAVAAADSSRAGPSMTVNLVGGQDVLTVPTHARQAGGATARPGRRLPARADGAALHRGRPPGRVPDRARAAASARCTAHGACPARASPGARCEWWLAQFEHEGTRRALLERHRGR